jgi:predicted dehydrogenase
MQVYGVGIIGVGFMGKTHAFAHSTIPYFYTGCGFKTKLVAACNRSLPKAEAAVSEYGFAYATTDEDEVFADPNVHLVHICTPNAAHYGQVKKALLAGKHVYCDKPFTMTADEAEELAELVKKQGLVGQVCFQNRFFPSISRAKAMIENSALGDLHCFRVKFLHASSINPERPMSWRYEVNGGVLLDLGSHALDLLYYLVGDFTSLYAKSRILHPFRKNAAGETVPVLVEDHINMVLTHTSGAIGTVEATKIATGVNDELEIELHGSKGAIQFALSNPNILYYYDHLAQDGQGFKAIPCNGQFDPPGGVFPPPVNTIGWLRAHCHSVYSFVENVHLGKTPSPSFDEGAYVQRLLDAAAESAKTGKEITL